MSSNLRIPKVCQFCGKDFIAKTSVTLFCSDRCSKYSYKQRKREGLIQKNLRKFNDVKEDQTKALQAKAFLDIKEACQLLGIGKTTLYSQIKSGVLPISKIGNRTIILRESIDTLLLNTQHHASKT